MRLSSGGRLAVAVAALGAFAAAAEPLERPADATPRTGETRETDLPRRDPRLALYLFDVHHQLDGQFDELAAETRAIFREMGADVTWREGGLGTTYGNDAIPEIPIIVLKTPPTGVANRASVMGLVPRGGSKAVWIFVDNIRRAVAPSGLAFSSEVSKSLGVAVGRVVAHEVVHALAPELAHTKQGLMRDALSRGELTSPARPAHDRCVTAVQAALGIVPRGPAAFSTESALLLRPPIF